MKTFWQALEDLPGPAAVASVWRRWVGDEFATVRSAFLQGRPAPAKSLPCPQECGCAHEVVRHDDGRMVAVCRCEPWNCDDIAVKEADLVVYELNWGKLGRAMAGAFGFTVKPGSFKLPGTMQVGAFGSAAVPVVLTIQHERSDFRSAVAELAARLREPFILFAPTSRFVDATCKELLANCRAGFFDLESHVTVLASGRLHAEKSGGELFAAYLPEKQEAGNAAEVTRVFGLLMKLKSKRVGMKAPLYDVFVMLVLEDKSQREAATACGCTEGLMSGRVKELQGVFDRSIQELKALRRPILEMETSVKGDRRRKRAPGSRAGGFSDGDKPEEEGDGASKEEYVYDPSENDS